jgi:very-short-patch-repair endonuclease
MEGQKFRRQQPLGRYIVDFVCFEKKLIVEVDGGQHSELVVSDSTRTAWLEAQGFRVLRFWNHQVLADVQAVKEAIREALSRT